MTTVQIWHTLAGVIALTPEGFGFSYCKTKDQVEKLRNDLLAGVPMASAVGNLGKCYSLSKLIYVESMQGSTTIDVEASQPYGITRESYAFQLQADREAFYVVLLQILGPTWKREFSKRKGCFLWILPTALILLGLFTILSVGLLYVGDLMPRHNVRAVDPPTQDGVRSTILVVGVALFILGPVVSWWRDRLGGDVWETVCRIPNP